ncbi:MAG: UDP-N-acetylmuramate dehydrogenase [Patescibacteria group bacterium]|nr:UDP-N-acetylmuramate dehydrogenase [Patescibacteria group bacterium]
MDILENVPLAPYTTFKIGGPARWFCEASSLEEIKTALSFAQLRQLPVFVLGGGSNLLVSDQGFEGLVLKINLLGKEKIKQDESGVWLKVASGENWDQVVSWAVERGWWGAENLSHIPGSCGAIAVQNVGAYGQEASRLVESVVVYDTASQSLVELKNAACGFAYRRSIFNGSQKGRYIILYLTLRLSLLPAPILEYRDLKERFAGHLPGLEEIRAAIIKIRNSKYPFPHEAKNGNAGSFFKNLSLGQPEYADLLGKVGAAFGADQAISLDRKKFADGEGKVKLPAAALIELCGLKDLKYGGAKINHAQPLVIVNDTGLATASDVLHLAGKVVSVVRQTLGLNLDLEPILLGFAAEQLKSVEI